MHYRSTREEREQEIENLLGEIMTDNFHNLAKEIDIQVQEVPRALIKMNAKSPPQTPHNYNT